MKATRFEIFAQRASKEIVDRRVSSVMVFRYHNSSWYTSNSAPAPPGLVAELDVTRKRGASWRHPNSRRAFFPVADLDAVLVGDFHDSPSAATRKTVEALVGKCLESSKNKYAADYRPLTGLLNREAFDEMLRTRIAAQSKSTSSGEIGVDRLSALALVAFDIDHFKQKNDTFGHQFGDIILRSLSIRCDEIASKSSDLAQEIVFAHPGGEEFLVLVSGYDSDDAPYKFAERLRVAVCDADLPSDTDLARMELSTVDRDSVPRDPNARRVRISCGVASLAQVTQSEDPANIVALLKRRSDRALYQAKRSGRNRTVEFSKIIESHGRVLEHCKEVNTVAIDIGTEVGVQNGQEFLIYHPQYDGEQEMRMSDGRSEVVLGKYPRRVMGRLVVFDPQSDIAFCEVPSENGSGIEIPAGARLANVPLGAIGHLIPASGAPMTKIIALAGRVKLIQELNAKRSAGSATVVASIGVDKLNDLTIMRGVAHVNAILAGLYEEIVRAVGRQFAFQLSPVELAFIVAPGHDFDTLVDGLRRSATELGISVAVGYSKPPWSFLGAEAVDADAQVEQARYALAMALSDEGGSIHEFSEDTMWHTLLAARRKGDYRGGAVDYERFLSWGAKDPKFDNQAALLLIRIDRRDEALACISRAVIAERDAVKAGADTGMLAVFLANEMILNANRNLEKALSSFLEALRLDFDFKEPYATAAVEILSSASYAKLPLYEAIGSGELIGKFDAVNRAELSAGAAAWLEALDSGGSA